MAFNLISIDQDGVVNMALTGDLDHDPAAGDSNPLAKCVGQEWASNRVLLDMDQANYLNSMALGWLLQSQKAFDREGGKLVLHSVPPNIQHVIRMMRIDKVLTMAADAADARTKLGLPPQPPGGSGEGDRDTGSQTSSDESDHTHDA